jgi:hypothetical protein
MPSAFIKSLMAWSLMTTRALPLVVRSVCD